MADYLSLLSILILLSAFMLVANKRVNSYIGTFRIQSALLVIVAVVIGAYQMPRSSGWELLILAVVTLAVKVIYIPHLLQRTVKQVEYHVAKDFFVSIPIGILICCGLVVLAYAVVAALGDVITPVVRLYLVDTLAVVLMGLFFMASRKRAVGQIIGLLMVENGIFSAAILSTRGMPMIVELGIFFDLLTAVLIMGVLVFRINENFDSIDMDKLNNLKG